MIIRKTSTTKKKRLPGVSEIRYLVENQCDCRGLASYASSKLLILSFFRKYPFKHLGVVLASSVDQMNG